MFSRCLTTRVTGYDEPSLQIMHMLYCFVNNIHVDYAELLWEGFHYSLQNPTTMIPYPRFTKLIVSHYMIVCPEISRKARDRYHNLVDDVILKSIFNLGKSKGNNVVPLRSNTIRLVQNGCSFHELRSEDPNQHLKDFLKLVDSLDLDGENRERTRLIQVEITVVVPPVKVNDEEEELAKDDYELRRREKGKHVEENRKTL
nr:MAK10-like protein [Tanacetum cinerariifolium]